MGNAIKAKVSGNLAKLRERMPFKKENREVEDLIEKFRSKEFAEKAAVSDEMLEKAFAKDPMNAMSALLESGADIQRALAESNNIEVRRGLARSELITGEAQKILVKDEDSGVRCYLAGNASIKEEIQTTLARDKKESIRCYLAGNASLENEPQKVLAVDEDENVKGRLARNTSIKADAQKILARDSGAGVRSSLSGNKSVIEEVKKELESKEPKSLLEGRKRK